MYKIIREYKYNYNWWLGFFDTVRLVLRYHKRISFDKNIMTAKDGEMYTIWTPKNQFDNEKSIQNNNKHCHHMWICLPGGMQDHDPGVNALYSNKMFNGSKICIFNNPGISTKMINKPLVSPVETIYIIEYIKYLKQNNNNIRISLIGFSIGSVQALRTAHNLNNDPTNDIKLESVVLIHAPDLVRDAVCSTKNNWFIRMDIYFAFHIRLLQYFSNSWKMVKSNMNNIEFYRGWKFIERISTVSLKKDWKKCEEEMFNLRNFCDETISKTSILRIISKNDWIVPFKLIDPSYFKYFKEVLITDRGGHCGIDQCDRSMSIIKRWNDNIVNNIPK